MSLRLGTGIGPLGGAGMVGLWNASSLIKSVQTGTILGDGSTTVTISSVVTTNSVLLWTGHTSQYVATASGNEPNGWITLTNSTTISATKSATSGTVTIGFIVLEFVPGVIKSVQYASATVPTSSASATASITAINTAKSCLMYLGTGGGPGSGIAPGYNYLRGVITSSTVVTAQFDGAVTSNSFGNPTLSVAIVEFF